MNEAQGPTGTRVGVTNFVFVEASTFLIDSTKLRENDCVQRFPPSPDPGGEG